MSRLRHMRLRLREQGGFGLIELMVAMFVSLIGVFAFAASTDFSRDSLGASERDEAASHVAEREMERILSLPYGEIRLSSTPATSPNPLNPGFYVSLGTPPRYRWDQRSGGSTATEPLIVDSSGACAAQGCPSGAPTAWNDGRLRGEVYRYVTGVEDTACGAACPASPDFKRVTVAVTADARAKRARKPIVTSSLVTDPSVKPAR